jgi:hypothetical protein
MIDADFGNHGPGQFNSQSWIDIGFCAIMADKLIFPAALK